MLNLVFFGPSPVPIAGSPLRLPLTVSSSQYFGRLSNWLHLLAVVACGLQMIPLPIAFLFPSHLFRSGSAKWINLIRHLPLCLPNLFACAVIHYVCDYSLLWTHFPAGSVGGIVFPIAQIVSPYRQAGLGDFLGTPDDGNAGEVPFLVHERVLQIRRRQNDVPSV